MEYKSDDPNKPLKKRGKESKNYIFNIILIYLVITLIITMAIFSSKVIFYGKNLADLNLLSIFAKAAFVIFITIALVGLLLAVIFVLCTFTVSLRYFILLLLSYIYLIYQKIYPKKSQKSSFPVLINKHLFKILHNVYKNETKELQGTKDKKYIIMSDCHRGVNDYADDFTQNELLYLHALNYYNDNDYTYIEIGDGDDLWENTRFNRIHEEHKHVFNLFKKFIDKIDKNKNRFFMVWGNHDQIKKSWERYNENSRRFKHFPDEFKNMIIPQAYLLKLEEKKWTAKVLLVHGHQLDYFNWHYKRFGKWVTRNFWTRLQGFGFHDTTSPAKNNNKRDHLAKILEEWLEKKDDRNLFLIAGHNHKYSTDFSKTGRYFNTGCCVYPRSITGIEIFNKNGFWKIAVVKWSLMSEAVKDIIESTKMDAKAKEKNKTIESKKPNQPVFIWKENVIGPDRLDPRYRKTINAKRHKA